MTLNGAIMQLVEMRENSMMPEVFKPYFDKVIETVSECEEPKRGEWVPYEFGDDTWHKCTACGTADKYIDIVKRWNGRTVKLEAVRNYCPKCGARMEKPNE